MKRFFLLIAICCLCFCTQSRLTAAEPVRVTLPHTSVVINQREMNNEYRRYPCIVYRGITYFPMTFDDCCWLDLQTSWTVEDGLVITLREQVEIFDYTEDLRDDPNPREELATVVETPVTVNGQVIDNNLEPYPLLLFRNITYFPLTWRFTVDEFGWKNSYDLQLGLNISSQWKVIDFTATDNQFYALDNKGNLWTWGEEEILWIVDGAAGRTEPMLLLDQVKEYDANSRWELHWAIRNDNSLWIWHYGYLLNYYPALEGYAAPTQEEDLLCYPYQVAEDVQELLETNPFRILKKDNSVWELSSNKEWVLTLAAEEPQNVQLPFSNVKEVSQNKSSSNATLEDGRTVDRYTSETYVLLNDGSLWLSTITCDYDKNDWSVPRAYPEPNHQNFKKLMDNVYWYDFKGRNLVLQNDGSLWVWGDSFFWLSPPMTIEEPRVLLTEVATVIPGVNCYLILKTDGSLWYWGFYSQGFPNGMNVGDGSFMIEYFNERQQAGARDTINSSEAPFLIGENIRAIHIAETSSIINLFFITSMDDEFFVLAIGHEDEFRKLGEKVAAFHFTRFFGLMQTKDGRLYYRITPQEHRGRVPSLFKDAYYAEDFVEVIWPGID